jgi:hypothetical protein
LKPVRVKVNDKMQKSYVYWRTKPMGRDFRPGFNPDLTPKQMLALGVFGGKYMTDCRREFPASWFEHAKFSKNGHRASLNYFGVNASQPLDVWRKKGWIYPDDPRAGSNGTAVIIRDDVVRTIYARLANGVQCDVTLRN